MCRRIIGGERPDQAPPPDDTDHRPFRVDRMARR